MLRLLAVTAFEPTRSGAECHVVAGQVVFVPTANRGTARERWPTKAPMPDVAAHAAHLLPHLEAVAEQLERNPGAVMRRAFPDSDPGSGSRAIVGPRSGLPPMAADRIDAALSAERKRLLEVGAGALDTLRAEGPGAVLTAEAQLGIEAIVSVARPAMVLQDGAFGDPPPPWDRHPRARTGESIRTTAMSVGRIGVPGLPQLPYAGTGFMVAEDAVMTNCHVAMVFSRVGIRRRLVVPAGPRGEPGLRRGPGCAAGRRRVAAKACASTA